MRPLRLRARNLRTYPKLDIRFGSGVVGILGELRDAPEGADSNGSGKSTILEAIDIALFGRRSLAGYLTRGGDVDELMVELIFEHGGSEYRVRRTYSAKGRGQTKVDLERAATEEPGVEYTFRAPTVYEPLTQASTRETDELLQQILGLSRDTFRDSSYLRQGDGGYADPDRDPRQRKELLVEAVLGRDPIWPRLLDLARARRKDEETQVERLTGEVESLRAQTANADALRGELRDAKGLVAAATAGLETTERRHAEVVELWARSRERIAACQAAAVGLQYAEAAVAFLEQKREDAERAAGEAVRLGDDLAGLATPEQLAEQEAAEAEIRRAIDEHVKACANHDRVRREYEAAFVERNRLLGLANEANERAHVLRREADLVLERAGDSTSTCATCGQKLGEEAAAHAAASYRVEAQQLDDQAKALDEQASAIVLPELAAEPAAPEGRDVLPEISRRVQTMRMQQQERARYEERLAHLQETIDGQPTPEEIAVARDTAAEKRAVLDALGTAEDPPVAEDTAQAAVAMARAARDEAVAAKARIEERLAQLAAAEDKLGELAATILTLHDQIDRDSLLERAYGRDGIPALIIENTAIPAIEAEASRILRSLGTSFDVQLRTQAETKTGNLRDTLDVFVIDPDGNEADYADGCSGGEQTRIGLALRIALARLLARRRGAESRLLALDEPSYLDAAGMAALLDVLRGLEDEFDSILLVSHIAELRDALDETILVIKENGVSRIDGAPVTEPAEAVAA